MSVSNCCCDGSIAGLTPTRPLQKRSICVVFAIVQAEENKESPLISYRRLQESSTSFFVMSFCQIRKIAIWIWCTAYVNIGQWGNGSKSSNKSHGCHEKDIDGWFKSSLRLCTLWVSSGGKAWQWWYQLVLQYSRSWKEELIVGELIVLLIVLSWFSASKSWSSVWRLKRLFQFCNLKELSPGNMCAVKGTGRFRNCRFLESPVVVSDFWKSVKPRYVTHISFK